MEDRLDAMGMLDLMVCPGFCVKDRKIVKTNQGADALMLTPGMDIAPLLATGREEYAEFQEGCLYLSLSIGQAQWGASVTRMGEFHVFLLDQEALQPQLQAMALAARELREPLTSVMTAADRLGNDGQADPHIRQQLAQLNRGLLQMLRLVGNMSDAGHYCAGHSSRMETLEIRGLMHEIFERSASLASQAGLLLTFQNLPEPIYCLADRDKLERAVLNILSNAMKFTPQGGTIDASLTRRGSMLYLQVQDSGPGIPEAIKGSLHSRYLRQPGIEDGRFGIGLGMVLIRSTALRHGGTVLADQPKGAGTRITMTLAIRQNTSGQLNSPLLRVDYAGERDHSLLELSESLPLSLYEEL